MVAIRLWRLGKSGGTQGNAEAAAVVAVRRVAPVPERRPTKRGLVEPTAATLRAGRALIRATRIADGTLEGSDRAYRCNISRHYRACLIDPRHSRLIVVLAQKLLAYTQKTAQAG